MKRLTNYIFYASLIAATLWSCNKKETPYSDVPKITLLGNPGNNIHWQDSLARIVVRMGFEDGGGNLGVLPTLGDTSIVVTNLRYNVFDNVGNLDTYARYVMPFPELNESEHAKNGNIDGQLDIILNNFYHYPRVDSTHLDGKDTCYWRIYIQDALGNKSNIVEVGPIYIEP